ncbi:MAG TPA: sigma-70 family RNA polymerase sigma factor [Rhodanobacteraceae bacterium]|nr:sigma-70 family RNA polymerase sigma factor [Rhodanobacteraceae bacterium]
MGRFDTTRWSVVLQARGDPAAARRALETLCRTYRPPVLAFVRSRGYQADAAEDLTQAFFARFLERAWHSSADPGRGRFRSFLLTALKRFLIDADAEATALKRGGAFRFETLEEDADDDAGTSETPESVFEREWAHAMLDAAFARLREEARSAGKLPLFERLSEFLIEPPDDSDYERVAADLKLRRNTFAVAVHRLRHRLRELVRDEISQTTSGRGEMEAELRALRGSMESASAHAAGPRA